MGGDKVYRGFIGTWVLIPETCDYEQSEPPLSGTYRIEEAAEEGLRFHMAWTDSAGEQHAASFSGIPDGKPRPFSGGDLADAMSITAMSERELWSSAFYRGKELMVAQRQLDDTGQAMRVIQQERLPDGTSPRNISVYRKQVLN